ncbi:MAG: hypothetical protein ABID79_04755 [Elusimicrobiota bacterium]
MLENFSLDKFNILYYITVVGGALLVWRVEKCLSILLEVENLR